MKILETDRLILRTISVEDAAFYFELVNSPGWFEFIGDRGVRTLGDAQEAILKGPVDMQNRLGFSFYVVELKSSSVAVGMCGLIKRDGLADVDIGYAFLSSVSGQ